MPDIRFYAVLFIFIGLILGAGLCLAGAAFIPVDPGATAWGYANRLPVSNVDCKPARSAYYCMVVPSTGPTRYVMCSNGTCEEIPPR